MQNSTIPAAASGLPSTGRAASAAHLSIVPSSNASQAESTDPAIRQLVGFYAATQRRLDRAMAWEDEAQARTIYPEELDYSRSHPDDDEPDARMIGMRRQAEAASGLTAANIEVNAALESSAAVRWRILRLQSKDKAAARLKLRAYIDWAGSLDNFAYMASGVAGEGDEIVCALARSLVGAGFTPDCEQPIWLPDSI